MGEEMGIETPYELDPPPSDDTAINGNNTSEIINATELLSTKGNKAKKISNSTKKSMYSKMGTDMSKKQNDLMNLELNFIRNVIDILGAERASGIRTALLGDVQVRGFGGLITQLQERPLSVILNTLDSISTTEDSHTNTDDDEFLNNGVTVKSGEGKRLYV